MINYYKLQDKVGDIMRKIKAVARRKNYRKKQGGVIKAIKFEGKIRQC